MEVFVFTAFVCGFLPQDGPSQQGCISVTNPIPFVTLEACGQEGVNYLGKVQGINLQHGRQIEVVDMDCVPHTAPGVVEGDPA